MFIFMFDFRKSLVLEEDGSDSQQGEQEEPTGSEEPDCLVSDPISGSVESKLNLMEGDSEQREQEEPTGSEEPDCLANNQISGSVESKLNLMEGDSEQHEQEEPTGSEEPDCLVSDPVSGSMESKLNLMEGDSEQREQEEPAGSEVPDCLVSDPISGSVESKLNLMEGDSEQHEPEEPTGSEEPDSVVREPLFVSFQTRLLNATLTDPVMASFACIAHNDHRLCIFISHYDPNHVKLSVTIMCDGSAKVFVHGIEIHKGHELLPNNMLLLDVDSVRALLADVRAYNVCAGNADSDFVGSFLGQDVSSTAFLEKNTGAVYGASVRSVKCKLLLAKGMRCKECSLYRGALRRKRSRSQAGMDDTENVDPKSWSKPFCKRTKQELIATVNAYKDHSYKLHLEVRFLQRKINRSLEKKSAFLSPRDEADIDRLFRTHDSSVSSDFKDHSFQKLFWEEQKKSHSLSSKKNMKWHPLIIKWCLYMHSKSSKAFEAMREAGFLRLPSQRTLFDYSHAMPSKFGFQPEYAVHMMKEAKRHGMYDNEWRKYVGILQDEVRLQEGLVYDKNSGELVGYVELDKFGNDLMELERHMKEEDELPLATHALVIMVRGITSSLRYPLAALATNGITADLLYPTLWKAVRIIELTCGLKVLFITCDGASPNRRFFAMHHVPGNGEKATTYYTRNPYARDGRRLYFISDAPHLLKTARNCFANSHSHKMTRELWKDGKSISWLHILQLYEEYVEPGLFATAYKLTRQHVDLTAFSVMKVNLAAQIMSRTVANALEEQYGERVSETVNFIRHMNRFFDCLNVRSTGEAHHTRNPDLDAYRDAEDARLDYLEHEFLGYFEAWEQSVMARPHYFTRKQQSRMMLSHQTLNGLKITVRSVVACVRQLLSEGVPFVLTHKFNQDPLESHFSHYRHKGGANDNPTAYQVKHTINTLRVIKSQALDPVRGNVFRQNDRDHRNLDEPLPRRRRWQKTR